MGKQSENLNPSNIHYYLDDIDTIFADINGQMHIYNYVEKGFVPCNIGLDIMKWHEFPACELHEIIEKTEKTFWYQNNSAKEI